MKDAAELSKAIRSAYHNGNTCQDDCVSDDKSSSLEVKGQRKKKGANKKGANKKGSNKKGSRTPKNDGSGELKGGNK